MKLEELLAAIRTEPDVTYEREVSVAAPELMAELDARRGMPLLEFMNDPRRHREKKVFRSGHLLGPGLDADAIERWQSQWPNHPLPADLRALLGNVNGIHLWADLDSGRAYEGLAPLAEWTLARHKMFGPEAQADALLDQCLAVSYHADNACFVVLNVQSQRYFLMDIAGPDETCPIGEDVEALLGWLWKQRVAVHDQP